MKRAIILILIISIAPGIFPQEQYDELFTARSLFERGMYDNAENLIRSTPESENDYRYQLLLGEVYIARGDYESAMGAFVKANMLAVGSGELGLARVYALLNNSRLSVSHLESHLKSRMRLPQRELLLNKDLQRIEESQEWKEMWKKNWYTQLDDGIAEVEYLIEKDRIEDARSVAKSFTGLYSEKAEVDYINGYLAFIDGKYDDASILLKKSIDKDPGDPGVRSVYIKSLGAGGNYTSAVNAASDAIEQFPDMLSFYIERAEYLRKSGEREKALAEVSKLVEFYPESEVLTDMAGRIAFETRNYNQALKYLSDNIDSHPGNPDHYSARGDVYLATRTWEFAIVDYSMALDLDPYNGDIYYKKGTALIETGNTGDACHDLKMALKLGNKKAAQLISRYCIK